MNDGTSSQGLGSTPQLSLSSPARLPPKLGCRLLGDPPRLNARWSRETGSGPRRRQTAKNDPPTQTDETATCRPAAPPRPRPAKTELDLTLIGCSVQLGEAAGAGVRQRTGDVCADALGGRLG